MNTIINCETGEVTVRPYTAAEQAEFDAAQKAWADGATDRAWADLRWQRNKLLTETDWMANSDYTMSLPWVQSDAASLALRSDLSFLNCQFSLSELNSS